MKTFTHSPWPTPRLDRLDDETGRWYLAGDTKYQSVTSYISKHWDKSGLDVWRERIGHAEAAHQSKTAIDRGKSIHGGIEHYLNNQGIPQYDDDPFDRMLFFKVQRLLDRIDNIKLIEKPLFSLELMLAGTPDVIADFDGERAVIDFKGSTKVKKKKYIVSYFLQCGFYGRMAREIYGETEAPKRAVIIMATEENPKAQLFTLGMNVCIVMTELFMKDPVAFQKKMVRLQKSK